MIIGEEPIEVFGWQRISQSGVDEAFIGQMRFAGNVMAQFDCGFRSPYRAEIEIVGSEGVLLIPNPFKPGRKEKIVLTRDGAQKTIQVDGLELYIGEVEDLTDAVLLHRSPRISLEESANNVSTILALIRSAQSGSPVKFS
jgi:predicted dehydrogenase